MCHYLGSEFTNAMNVSGEWQTRPKVQEANCCSLKRSNVNPSLRSREDGADPDDVLQGCFDLDYSLPIIEMGGWITLIQFTEYGITVGDDTFTKYHVAVRLQPFHGSPAGDSGASWVQFLVD